MGGGYRSPVYLIWVFGGLAVIVGVSVALGLSDPTNQNVIFAILPMLAVYLGGIFVMQARMAVRSTPGVVAPPGDASDSADNPPADRAELAGVLAVETPDEESQRAARRAGRSLALGQVGFGAVLSLLILVCVGLFYAGVDNAVYPLGESGPGFPVVFVPVFAAIVYGVLRIPFTIGRSVAAAGAQLEPLGLTLTETPSIGVRPKWGDSGVQTDVQGPSVISGRRHGREVRIETDGKRFTTRVAERTPKFSVSSDKGRLLTEGKAPAGVESALSALEPAARWRGVEVEGGADGVVVSRRGGATAASEQRWLDDLWLAERLADATGRSKRSKRRA